MSTALKSDREAPEPFDLLEARSGIDYALRTIQQSQVQFSLMADSKANIMITVCSIVISASLTQVHRPEFLWPMLALDLFTAVSLVAALLCVLPSNRRPPMRNGEPDVEHPGFNPFFFMHFRHLPPERFEREVAARSATSGELYRSLVRDIYGGGVVLATSKYRYMRISYLSFIVGLFAGFGVALCQLLVA